MEPLSIGSCCLHTLLNSYNYRKNSNNCSMEKFLSYNFSFQTDKKCNTCENIEEKISLFFTIKLNSIELSLRTTFDLVIFMISHREDIERGNRFVMPKIVWLIILTKTFDAMHWMPLCLKSTWSELNISSNLTHRENNIFFYYIDFSDLNQLVRFNSYSRTSTNLQLWTWPTDSNLENLKSQKRIKTKVKIKKKKKIEIVDCWAKSKPNFLGK